MEKITITEKYALCMLKEMKHFEHLELNCHLLISMIIEMMLEECLEIVNYNNRKFLENEYKFKIKLLEREPTTEYNKRLYNIIKEKNKTESSIVELISEISTELSQKRMNLILQPLKEDMIKHNLISLETKKGLLGEKEIVIINVEQFNLVINEIREKFLNEGKMDNDFTVLAALLNSTRFLKNIFIKYEKETLEKRLEEIKNTEISKSIELAQYVISSEILDLLNIM